MEVVSFGFARRPFRSTPDLRSYYPSPTHESAVRSLMRAFADRDGVAIVSGEAGSGKTIVALKFLESLEGNVARVLIPAPRFSRPADLFQAILFDLDVEYRGLSEHELRLALTEHLLKSLVQSGPTVIAIDEAQHLSTDILEEIRLLGNIENQSDKAVFAVLIGQQGLREKLSRPEGAALAQRAAVKAHIEPLEQEESAKYLWHQLHVAGGHPALLISEEAIGLITAHCKGLPRLLNQATSLSFTLASSAQSESVDTEAAQEALTQLGLWTDSIEEPVLLPHPATPKPRMTAKTKQPRRKSA